MSKVSRAFAPLSLLFVIALGLAACQTQQLRGLAPYDPAAAQRTAELKVASVNLIAKSGERFSRHAAEVSSVTAAMDTAYELARATPGNELVTQQWEIMRNPEGALYGGFIKRWQANGTVSAAFREEITPQIAAAFDLMLCLENAKRTPMQCGAAQ